MKKGIATETIVIMAIGLIALIVFITIFSQRTLDAGKSVTGEIAGCPIDVELNFDCPCQGQIISKGYCCPDGPSPTPCENG